MTEQEVFRKAKETLLKRGWVQGRFQTPSGVCLGHALCSGPTIVGMRAMSRAQFRTGGITAWNDVRHRTFDEVVGLLDELAAEAAAEEAGGGVASEPRHSQEAKGSAAKRINADAPLPATTVELEVV